VEGERWTAGQCRGARTAGGHAPPASCRRRTGSDPGHLPEAPPRRPSRSRRWTRASFFGRLARLLVDNPPAEADAPAMERFATIGLKALRQHPPTLTNDWAMTRWCSTRTARWICAAARVARSGRRTGCRRRPAPSTSSSASTGPSRRSSTAPASRRQSFGRRTERGPGAPSVAPWPGGQVPRAWWLRPSAGSGDVTAAVPRRASSSPGARGAAAGGNQPVVARSVRPSPSPWYVGRGPVLPAARRQRVERTAAGD
jgi:hypothetical protein